MYTTKNTYLPSTVPKSSPWSEPVIISSLWTKYNTRHKSLKQEPFVLNFSSFSRVFWSSETTVIPKSTLRKGKITQVFKICDEYCSSCDPPLAQPLAYPGELCGAFIVFTESSELTAIWSSLVSLPVLLAVLYSTANDPQQQMIPRPQMIPKMDRKWFSNASDPQSWPQMIQKEK